MKSENRYYPVTEDLSFRPISAEEELALFRTAKSGDLAAREVLIKRHLAYVLKLGRQFCASRLPTDDTTSAANEALMKAIESFDPEKGTCFRSYLKPFVRAAIARCWRSLNNVNFKNTPPTQQVSLDDSYSGHSLIERGENSEFEAEDHADYLKKNLLDVSEGLPEREQEVIRLHYVEGYNFAEIGRVLNLSREAIRLIHGRILVLLKKKLESRGITSTR